MGKLNHAGYLYIDSIDYSLPTVDKVEENKNMTALR